MPRYKRPDGYIEVKRPDITENYKGYMKEHRAVWIDAHGTIPAGAIVHHKNGIRNDNRLENLELYRSNGIHLRCCHSAHIPGETIAPFTTEELVRVRERLPLDRLKAHTVELANLHG